MIYEKKKNKFYNYIFFFFYINYIGKINIKKKKILNFKK